MKSMYRLITACSVSALVVSCGASPPLRPVSVATPGPDSTSPQAPAHEEPTQATVNIAEDIRSACGLQDLEARFAYNSANVSESHAPVLRKLAECFSSGALAGREMRLVGHADPRGEDEYNYLLGQRRADGVKATISRFGLIPERISTTSRGENESIGTDETGWAKDRRVDVLLGGG